VPDGQWERHATPWQGNGVGSAGCALLLLHGFPSSTADFLHLQKELVAHAQLLKVEKHSGMALGA
jgi:hypothetical protein